VLDYDGQRLLLGIGTAGLANTFRQGHHAEVVRQALIEAIGLDTRVEGVPVDDAGGPGGGGPSGGGAGGPAGGPSGARPGAAAGPAPTVAEQLGASGGRPPEGAGQADWSRPGASAPAWATEEPTPGPERASSTEDRPAGQQPAAARSPRGDMPSTDDEDLESSGAVGQPVVESVLGGTVIAVDDDPSR
jgi:DNA polymerase-3 subunit gamma/tau